MMKDGRNNMTKNYAVMTVAGIIGFILILGGCGSQPAKSDAVLNEIRTEDYGRQLNSSTIKKNVSQKILTQIRKNMVDPDSTKIVSIQTSDFKKCALLVQSQYSSPNKPKGYCVRFEYNSKNRMGGYAGGKLSDAFVRYENNGKIHVIVQAGKTFMSSEKHRYPFTLDTGVYALTWYDKL